MGVRMTSEEQDETPAEKKEAPFDPGSPYDPRKHARVFPIRELEARLRVDLGVGGKEASRMVEGAKAEIRRKVLTRKGALNAVKVALIRESKISPPVIVSVVFRGFEGDENSILETMRQGEIPYGVSVYYVNLRSRKAPASRARAVGGGKKSYRNVGTRRNDTVVRANRTRA